MDFPEAIRPDQKRLLLVKRLVDIYGQMRLLEPDQQQHIERLFKTQATADFVDLAEAFILGLGNTYEDLVLPKVYKPPASVHCCCNICGHHFISTSLQEEGRRFYSRAFDDEEAQSVLNAFLDQTRAQLNDVGRDLKLYGDLIMSRWSKKGKKGEEKRKKTLVSSAGDIFRSRPKPDIRKFKGPSSARDVSLSELVETAKAFAMSTSEGNWMFAPWLDLATFADDPMKLLSLLHMRTTYPPQDWGAFDAVENDAFRHTAYSKVPYNTRAVIMHGSEYGTLIDFDVGPAHTYAIAGFPCAYGAFFAQHQIATMLSTLVGNIVNGASPTGCSEWSMMVSGGLRSSHNSALWSPYYHEPFTRPREFDIAALLEKAKTKLHFVEDEIELMQTSPEYMHRYAVEHKATRTFCTATSADAQFEAIAWSIMSFWTDQLATWQLLVSETELLLKTVQHSGFKMRPGTRVSQETAIATATFSKIVKKHSIRQCERAIDLLLHVRLVKEAHQMYAEKGLPMSHGRLRNVAEDPFQRLLLATHSLQRSVRDESSRETAYNLQMMVNELPEPACDKTMDVLISSIALLDEISRMMSCSQLEISLDPVEEEAANTEAEYRGRVHIYVSTRKHKSGAPSDRLMRPDLKLGKLLRSFCNAPLPKSSSGLTSLERFSENRKRLAEFWGSLRVDWKGHQVRKQACQSSVTAVLAKMSCNESQEYLSKIGQEEKLLDTERQQVKAKKGRHQESTQFFQQSWDTQASGTDLACRKRTRAKAARDAMESQPASEGVTAGAGGLEPTKAESKPEPIPKIPVKQSTLDVTSLMFSSTLGSSKRIRWPEFTQALADAGMIVTEGAGSAVNFACDNGSITFHKPHPVPVLDSLVLRHFGSRLWKWFGWTEETFVLRKKGD